MQAAVQADTLFKRAAALHPALAVRDALAGDAARQGPCSFCRVGESGLRRVCPSPSVETVLPVCSTVDSLFLAR